MGAEELQINDLMKITRLKEEGHLITTLEHNKVLEFLNTTMKEEVSFVYACFSIYMIIISVSFSIMSGWSFYQLIVNKDISPILSIGIGALFSFSLMIIVHELIHAMAYKLVGGKNIYFGSQIKKFVFYAASDKHVYNGHQFYMVAIAPFLVVNLIGIILCVINFEYFFYILTILSTHTLFCSGDFAFLNFISKYNLNEFYTYDCRTERKSFYYILDK